MNSLHFINGKCDELLANDIVNQLQSEFQNKNLLIVLKNT